MSSIGTIYAHQGHYLANKVRNVAMCLIENTGTSCCSNDQALIAAAIAGLNIQLKETKVNPDTKTPEYLAKFPTGKIPAFESSDGLLLVESTAIARYGKSSSFHELITILQYSQRVDFCSRFTSAEFWPSWQGCP
jgi:hypothetical protein